LESKNWFFGRVGEIPHVTRLHNCLTADDVIKSFPPVKCRHSISLLEFTQKVKYTVVPPCLKSVDGRVSEQKDVVVGCFSRTRYGCTSRLGYTFGWGGNIFVVVGGVDVGDYGCVDSYFLDNDAEIFVFWPDS